MSALLFGRDVILQTHGQDKYGRTLADVLLPDGTNINHELVRGGWCWWYWKYASAKTELGYRLLTCLRRTLRHQGIAGLALKNVWCQVGAKTR